MKNICQGLLHLTKNEVPGVGTQRMDTLKQKKKFK